jgi:hypothetical protein
MFYNCHWGLRYTFIMLLTYISMYCTIETAYLQYSWMSIMYHNTATIRHSFILTQSIATMALKCSALLYADFHYAFLL